MGPQRDDGAAAGGLRVAVCVLLALAGVLLALYAVVDLWLQTLDFGGGAPEVSGRRVVGHLSLVAAGVLGPVAATRLLLGRVAPALQAAAGVAGVLLGLAVLGLAR